MLGGLACCFLIYRLAESLVGRGTGMLAAIALAGSPAMIVYSSQARPYTLAVAACLATVLCLQRWLAHRAWRWGIGAAISMALAVHLHLLFAAFAVVPAFMIWLRARGGERIAWKPLFALAGVTAVLLLPWIPRLLMLSRAADPSALPPPRLSVLLNAWLPEMVLLALVAFAFLLIPARRVAVEAFKQRLPGARCSWRCSG